MTSRLTKWSRLASLFSRKPPLGEAAPADGLYGMLGSGGACSPDDLVSRRGFEIYDRMQRDAQVAACLSVKKLAVLSRGWQIHPAGDSPKELRAADFVRFCFQDMRGSIVDVLYKALDALAKGFSILEINYKIIESGEFSGLVGLDSIKAKDPSRIEFRVDEFMNIRSLRLRGIGANHPLTGGAAPGRADLDLPREKFIIYTYMPRYESPYGTSDLRAAHKHWWSKDVILRFFNVYLEKYGSPTAVGSYQRGMPKSQQDELLRVLDKIQQETAIVIPEDIKVQLLEAQRGGEAGYIDALAYHDRQIAKAILGQTLVTDEGLRYGSYALAKVHLDVLRMHLEKIKRDLEETVVGEQIIRPLMEYNFQGLPVSAAFDRAKNSANYSLGGGWRRGINAPRFSLGSLDERDLASTGDLIARLVDGGIVAPDEPWIREYLGLPEDTAEASKS